MIMVSPLAQALAFQNSVQPAQSGVAPTDVVGAYKLANEAATRNYQARLAQQQAMFGGLAGIGSAGIMGFGPSLAKKWFGAGLPTAAGAAPGAAEAAGVVAPAATSALPTAAGSAMASPFGWGGATLGADVAGTGIADAGLGTLAPAAASVAGDIGAAGAGTAVADAAASTIPEWLTSFLPFLALA